MIINKELYEKVKEITCTNYEPYMTKNEDKFYIDNEGAICMIEDLLYELDSQQERFEDMEEYFKTNYQYVGQQNFDPDAFI